jgi:hypothetical protein
MRLSVVTLVGLVSALPLPAAARTSTELKPRPEATRTTERSTAMTPRRAPSRAPGSRADAKRYAERDARSKAARNYRAGDDVVVVFGASTLTIIHVIVLLVVLL